MSESAKIAISTSLQGNSYRRGISHTKADKAKIAAGVKKAYLEGRHPRLSNPQNLANRNRDVQAGLVRSAKLSDEKMREIASHYKNMGLDLTAAYLGLSKGSVRYVARRLLG